MDRASRLGITPPEITCDLEGLGPVITQTGLDIKDFETYGGNVRIRGYLHQRTEKVYGYLPRRMTTILRNVKIGWDAVDGTQPEQKEDTYQRYTFGPTWRNNSCAVDCTLFCAIALDAGRIQLDQVTSATFSELEEPARVLRKIVCRYWGLISQDTRDQMRDVLRQALNSVNPEAFPVAPAVLPIAEVLNCCFQGLPQLSFTAINSIRCGSGECQVSSRHRPDRYVSIFLSTPTVRAGVQSFFGEEVCQRAPRGHGSCRNTHIQQKIILDRLPPTLIIHLPETGTVHACKRWLPFEDIEVTWRRPRGRSTTLYHTTGAVFTVGRKAATHFVVVWRVNDSFYLYDGMVNNGEVRNISGWFDVPGRLVRVATVILRSTQI